MKSDALSVTRLGAVNVLASPRNRSSGRVRTYLLWSFLAGLAFVAVYPASNWITSLRRTRLHLYIPQELAIPFIPQFIWVYLSMYLLFLLPLFFVPTTRMPALGRQLIVGSVVSAGLFLLFPADLGFVRELPAQAPYAAMFARVFSIDRPHNLVPSLHVIWSCAIGLACAGYAQGVVRLALYVWLTVVVASTVFVHQHHLLDLLSAFAIVVFLRRRYEVNHA
jgi:hypothetical protein